MRKPITVLLPLAVVGAFVYLVGCQTRSTPATQGVTWGVVVGPTPDRLSVEPLPISKSRGDEVHWAATPSTKLLFIEFEQQIFVNAQPINGRYRVRCSEGVCESGAVVASPPPPPTSAGYKYWQGLADPSAPKNIGWADGHIIINP